MSAGSGVALLLDFSFYASILAVVPGLVMLGNRNTAEAQRLGLTSQDQPPDFRWSDLALAMVPVLTFAILDAFVLNTGDAGFGFVMTLFAAGMMLALRVAWRRNPSISRLDH